MDTCKELKQHYNDESCCGNPIGTLKVIPGTAADCLYNFDPVKCTDAEPQAPRDLSSSAPAGKRIPKAIVLTEAQAEYLPLTNVHFHKGAEHKADGYKDGSGMARRLAEGPVAAGWRCGDPAALSADEKKPYSFSHCKNVEVGETYEIHYVHSSAGWSDEDIAQSSKGTDEKMQDGLGGAANGRGMLNPMVVVQAQVYQIVQGAQVIDDMLHGWLNETIRKKSSCVMYAGSTTGPSNTNEFCSPFTVTWHVDKDCHQVSPESFDNLCKQMWDDYKLDLDRAPHGSREIVSADHVVKSEYVKALA